MSENNRFKVPIHNFTWTYYVVFACFFFYFLALLSGLLLLPFFQATTSEATSTLNLIDHLIPNGFLVRNFHTWCGSFLIGSTIFAIVSAFVSKAYMAPRQLTWVSGLVVFFLTVFAGYSGHILPWNQLSVCSTRVSMAILTSTTTFLPAPLTNIGHSIAQFLMGSETLDQATLSRFFALHIFVIPFLLFVFLATHLKFIFKHGLSTNDVEVKGYMSITKFAYRCFALYALLLLLMLVIAQTLPFDSFLTYQMKIPFDENFPTPIGVRPEWYLLFISYTIRILPQNLVMAIMTILGGAIVFAPFVFANVSRKVHVLIATVAIGYFIVMTAFGPEIITMLGGTV